ncbi:hypothetical protein [Lysinibacillus fusiformis]|uniref:hypothetical protein n=1 Tax=Lysinibacillus fusiformis TaxID=28031 RepID=UPI000D3AA284|nr:MULTISPECIES: hypothetical protein [Lysinibacillus]MED4668998.1 hypothetical protein [Lysinibacillus fusiformis]QAS57257.1 hypothetical protein LSP_13360 [Lysinibacillus sphaericus]RDV24974.1 hypothetical protein C7B90_23175 [Lysinibacillus fusiformis]GED63297.1 hypothetical protein LFU01_17490 [Lysinibacillus fusiformis]
MLQIYLLYFNIEFMKIQAEVLQLRNETAEVLDQELQKVLQAEGYDFYDYSDEITILVDDRGFKKTLNPVFELVSTFGDRSHLAGRLVFVRNVENEYSTDIGSIKYEDIFNLRINLDINLVGMT